MFKNLLIVALFALSAQARVRIWNYCQQGGQTVSTATIVSTTKVQQSFSGCTVQVNVTGTTTLATIYSDNNGTPLANPFTADTTTGYFYFYADTGTYDLLFSGGGITTPYTWGAVTGIDPTALFTPEFLYAHFRDDDESHLRLDESGDGVNWSTLNKQGSFSATSFRDPSVLYVPAVSGSTGAFYFLATPSSGCNIQFVSSVDLITFTVGSSINMASYAAGCQTAWAPEWFHDPVSGNYYFWVSIGTVANPTYNSPKTPWVVQFNPLTGLVVGTPTAISLSGTSQGNTFDYFPWYSGGVYYILYVDQTNNPTVTQPIAYATASSLTGAYTQQTTPGADYYDFGTFQTEAPSLFQLPNNCVRIMVDEWLSPSWGGRDYHQYYRDSCPSSGSLFTSASLVNAATQILSTRSEHGTVIPLNTSSSVGVVMNAAAYTKTDGNYAGDVGVNVAQPLYPLEVGTHVASSGGILYPQPASIGLNPSLSRCSPWGSSECAAITVCGTAAQSCWPNWPGSGRLFQNYTGDGGFGMFQFINSKSDETGEASILFGDGITQPGQVPVSSFGDKAIWTISENNQAFNVLEKHRFGIYNKGIVDGGGIFGGFPISISPTTGGVLLPWGLNLGIGNGSAYASTGNANIDAWGSVGGVCPNCGQRINMGDGSAFGARNAALAVGSVNVQNFVAQSGGANTDLAGFLVIGGGGTVTQNFAIGTTGVYSSQPLCTGSDATAANPVRVYTSVSGSNYVLNIAGTPGDTVNYVCIAHSF